jgi:Zn-dependent peptidase ImmA (M78 family)
VTDSPEAAARQARHELALGLEGPVPDILQRLERDAGVAVVVARLPEGGPAGAYTAVRGVPFILVNAVDPIVRQRFTLAHEFGHHRLHHGDVLDEHIVWDSTDPREAAANGFAAEFLVPVAAVDLWFQAHSQPRVGLEELVRLANHFGVSCEVALWRAKSAGRITSSAATKLKSRLVAHEHWGMARELGLRPFIDTLSSTPEIDVRVPAQMTDDVLRALEAGIIDSETAALRLRLTSERLQELIEALGVDDE